MAQHVLNSTRKLVADASTLLGPFKRLQSTNYVLSADLGANSKEIEETKDRIAQHWRETSTEIVLIYHHSDLFQGKSLQAAKFRIHFC
jgi:oligoribonuclease NrnB/cAMP/cGMP phosphodiesterase (DHH superfamily)